jgi:hypothetical protein
VVVARGVGGHDNGEPTDTRPAQQARDTRLRGAGVEQQRRAIGVLDEGRVALADVEEADREPIGRARRGQQGGHRDEGARRQRGAGRTTALAREAVPGGGPAGEVAGERGASAPGAEGGEPEGGVGAEHGGRRAERQLELTAGHVGEALAEGGQIAQGQ